MMLAIWLVMPPSSGTRDGFEKLAEYQTNSSLEVYVIASQDEPVCWLCKRERERALPVLRPAEIAGHEALIVLQAQAVELPLSGIYRRMRDT